MNGCCIGFRDHQDDLTLRTFRNVSHEKKFKYTQTSSLRQRKITGQSHPNNNHGLLVRGPSTCGAVVYVYTSRTCFTITYKTRLCTNYSFIIPSQVLIHASWYCTSRTRVLRLDVVPRVSWCCTIIEVDVSTVPGDHPTKSERATRNKTQFCPSAPDVCHVFVLEHGRHQPMIPMFSTCR